MSIISDRPGPSDLTDPVWHFRLSSAPAQLLSRRSLRPCRMSAKRARYGSTFLEFNSYRLQNLPAVTCSHFPRSCSIARDTVATDSPRSSAIVELAISTRRVRPSNRCIRWPAITFAVWLSSQSVMRASCHENLRAAGFIPRSRAAAGQRMRVGRPRDTQSYIGRGFHPPPARLDTSPCRSTRRGSGSQGGFPTKPSGRTSR